MRSPRDFFRPLALGAPDEDAVDKIAIAGVFHDLGIWTDGTFDYLAPSVRRGSVRPRATGRQSPAGAPSACTPLPSWSADARRSTTEIRRLRDKCGRKAARPRHTHRGLQQVGLARRRCPPQQQPGFGGVVQVARDRIAAGRRRGARAAAGLAPALLDEQCRRAVPDRRGCRAQCGVLRFRIGAGNFACGRARSRAHAPHVRGDVGEGPQPGDGEIGHPAIVARSRSDQPGRCFRASTRVKIDGFGADGGSY